MLPPWGRHTTRKPFWLRPLLERLEDRRTPAAFHVDTLADTVAVNLVTGQDSGGQVSLRSALMAANSQPGQDTIDFQVTGTILLNNVGPNEDGAATGDLDILDHVIIEGLGPGQTVIDGNATDRIFQVFPNIVAELHNLTLQDG